MTPSEAERAVRDGATVSLHSAHDHREYAVGKAISFSLVPTITIELSPGGSHISWAAEARGADRAAQSPRGHAAVHLRDPSLRARGCGRGDRVRTAAKVSPWHDADGNGHTWSELVDPEVLSEGVTP